MQPNQPTPLPQTPTPEVNPPVATPAPIESAASLHLKKKSHKGRWIIGIVAALLAVILIAIGSSYTWYQQQLSSPQPTSTETTRLTIAQGSTSADVAKELASRGVIKNQFAFELYYRFHQRTGLKAGTYIIEKKLSVGEIVEHLEAGKPDEFTLTFLPGATLSDAKKVLQGAGYQAAEIDAAFAAQYDHPLLKGRPADADLEGYIYGDTYNFYSGASIKDILMKLFDHMYQDVTENKLEQAYTAQGMTLYQGIIFASIVQSEVSNKADMPHVSQVFHKRLAEDMQLGSDVTFIYGARKLGVAPTVDLDSPYNTRVRKGLPPTPVANPGIDALIAGAHPSATDDMYFVAGDDGVTYFSKTNAEHEQATREHCQKNCELPAR